jgi:single-strand DNA-binding protein
MRRSLMNEAETTLVGNIGGEPDLRFTPNGIAVIKFSVAVTPRVKDGNEWKDGEATWYNCTAWRDLAEHCAETLTKGMRVIAKGRLSLRTFEYAVGDRKGQKGSSLELEVDAVGPELRYATATVVKATKSDSGGGFGNKSNDQWAGASKERPANADTQRTAPTEDKPPW